MADKSNIVTRKFNSSVTPSHSGSIISFFSSVTAMDLYSDKIY